ncbi:MAG: hypothetical protein J6U68_04120, partial [Clostridia bacterium]|nr:hypothetical protein [Clostridia bacterium]
MKTTKFQRITALLLAVLCFFGGATVVASADTVSSKKEESSLASIKELLNAISYSEYVELEEYGKAGVAKAPVSVSGVSGEYVNEAGDKVSSEGNDYILSGDVEKDATANEKFDRSRPGVFTDTSEGSEKKGLYIPDTGEVSWNVEGITEAAKYNMYIEYYPFANKSADVERIFLLNGEVPFAEARYISMSKYWS